MTDVPKDAREQIEALLHNQPVGYERQGNAHPPPWLCRLALRALDMEAAASAETEAVRALAAELVEGLAGMVMRYGDFAPGEPFLFPPNHHIDLARALIARARALGIGGEREKGDG